MTRMEKFFKRDEKGRFFSVVEWRRRRKINTIRKAILTPNEAPEKHLVSFNDNSPPHQGLSNSTHNQTKFLYSFSLSLLYIVLFTHSVSWWPPNKVNYKRFSFASREFIFFLFTHSPHSSYIIFNLSDLFIHSSMTQNSLWWLRCDNRMKEEKKQEKSLPRSAVREWNSREIPF